MDEPKLPRNLGLELVRTTEAAALSAGRWMGLGNAKLADEAASDAMLEGLNAVRIQGQIVMGEEGKPAHDLPIKGCIMVGTGEGPEVDVVVDPIDGRTQLARGYPGAISVAAVAPRGTMWNCSPAVYMDKIIVDAATAPYLVPECLDAPVAWTLALVARAKGVPVENLTVFVLDRVRHTELIEEVWGMNFDMFSDVVKVVISRLRKKLEANGGDSLINTVRGVGYIMADPQNGSEVQD